MKLFLAATAIQFGKPSAELLYCALTWILFLGVGGGFYWLLATENAFKREVRAALGNAPLQFRKRNVFLVVSAFSLLLCGWFYHKHLYSRFFSVEPVRRDGEIRQWNVGFAYPKREIRLSTEEIESWHIQIDWSHRTPMQSIILLLENDRYLRSAPESHESIQKDVRRLKELGIEVRKKESPEEPRPER